MVTVLTLAGLSLRLPHGPHRPAVRKLLLMALFLPFFLGQVVRAYGWLILLGKQGLLNATLAGAGLPTVQLIYTYPGVLIGLVQYMPFAVLLLAPALTAIPAEIELASASLGARAAATLRHPPAAGEAGPRRCRGRRVHAHAHRLRHARDHGRGGNDFIANAVYDAFFQLSDAGMGGAMGVALTLLGTLLVGIAFTLAGLGTLAYVQRRAA